MIDTKTLESTVCELRLRFTRDMGYWGELVAHAVSSPSEGSNVVLHYDEAFRSAVGLPALNSGDEIPMNVSHLRALIRARALSYNVFHDRDRHVTILLVKDENANNRRMDMPGNCVSTVHGAAHEIGSAATQLCKVLEALAEGYKINQLRGVNRHES